MSIFSSPVNFVKVSIGSKRSSLLAIAVVSAMAILLAVLVFVAKRSSAHGVTPAKKKQQGCCSNQPAVPRRVIGTYYTTEDGFRSTLVLNNIGLNQIMITPILHSRNGQTFIASPVAVGGQSSFEVDLNLPASIAGPQFRSGSFEFTYEGRILEVGGWLRIVNAEKSLIFDEVMLEPGMKFPASQLEAVYAIPFEDSQVSVIVTNTTAQPIFVNGDAVFAGANGHHPIQGLLGPYETQVVNLPRGLVKKASAGAVSLDHKGAKGALLAMIHLWDADRGYSEAVNFANPGGKTTERHGAGLRLGSVDNDSLRPVIAVRNIGENATTVTATVPYSKWNGATGTIALPQVSLAPGAIKLLDTSNPQLRRNDFTTAGLEIEYTGAAGSVIASATSVSQSGNQVFALPLKDPKASPSNGGYPWFVSDTRSTVVFVKNVTDKTQRFFLNIIYPGGRWESGVRPVAPAQTVAIDVRKIRDSQEKDSEGDKIPGDATAGQISWSFVGTQNASLIGRAETSDTGNALTSTYGCVRGCFCGSAIPVEARLLPGSVSSFPGDSSFFQKQTRYEDCLGDDLGWQNVFSVSNGFFGSDNSNVATFDGEIGRAIAPGTTFLNAQWQEEYQDGVGSDEAECFFAVAVLVCAAFCDVADVTISGPVNCMDGGSANFSVNATGGTVQSYQWTFEVPSGAGNNPNPQFGSPSSASTTAKCHWFANPNQECPATNCVSTYKIKCEVTFQGGQRKTKETSLSVDGCWNPAGFVDPNEARVTGAPDMAPDTSGVWRVMGMGNLGRRIPSKVVIVPTSSQFRNKTDVHETEHLAHWQPGNLFGNLHNPADFFARIRDFTGTSQIDLVTKLGAELTTYTNEQGAIFERNRRETEKRAHAKSDPVAPKYLYQNCGRF